MIGYHRLLEIKFLRKDTYIIRTYYSNIPNILNKINLFVEKYNLMYFSKKCTIFYVTRNGKIKALRLQIIHI